MSSKDINQRLYFKKYKIKKLLAETSCCKLFEGINIIDKEPVAMKFEKRQGKYDVLESEAYCLFDLKGYGIPRIITYGKTLSYNILIEELLGPSIYSLWKSNQKTNRKLSLKDICMLSLQCIDRLNYIHSKYIIHRDIKPENFLIGLKDPNVIYLIDFGFHRKYRSSRTGKHIKYTFIKKVIGSLKYISINGNKGFELSRRDDLESLGYMLIDLGTNYLPWGSTVKLTNNINIKMEAVFKLKYSSKPEQLCKGLPEEFAEYIKYVRKLEFEEEPDYRYLKGLFISVLSRNQLKNDLLFSWTMNKRKASRQEQKKEGNSKEKRRAFTKTRTDSKKRLYIQIKKSLEKYAFSEKIIFSNKKPNINKLNNIGQDNNSKSQDNKMSNNYFATENKKKIKCKIINVLPNTNNLKDNICLKDFFKKPKKNINILDLKENSNINIINNVNTYNNHNISYLLKYNSPRGVKKSNRFNNSYKDISIKNKIGKINNNNLNNKSPQQRFKLLYKNQLIYNYSYKTIQQRERIKKINPNNNRKIAFNPIKNKNNNNKTYKNIFLNSFLINNKTEISTDNHLTEYNYFNNN